VHAPLAIECAGDFIEETTNTKFLCVKSNNNWNWKNHIDQILSKLDAACFAVRRLFHKLNIDVLRMVYFAHFHSIIKYGIVF
jgi:hypothetical protein